MVVDTSVILALFFNEPHASWCAEQLATHAVSLRMSTVNLAETLIMIKFRQPQLAGELESQIFSSGIRFEPPDIHTTKIAASVRGKFPLNLGDCFAYALAKKELVPVLTLDRDFLATDVPVLIPNK